MQQPAYPSEIFSAWDGQTVHRSEPETHCGFSFENGRNFGPMEADRQEALASQNLKEIDLKHADEESTSADEEPSSSPLDAVSIHPRRKAGEPRLERGQKRESVLLTKKYLLSCFGLPMPYVASKLGLGPTALKRACRRMGIRRWPAPSIRTDTHLDGHQDAASLAVEARAHHREACDPGAGALSTSAHSQSSKIISASPNQDAATRATDRGFQAALVNSNEAESGQASETSKSCNVAELEVLDDLPAPQDTPWRLDWSFLVPNEDRKSSK